MKIDNPKRLPRYPFDAKDVPDDYVLRGDGWWVPRLWMADAIPRSR